MMPCMALRRENMRIRLTDDLRQKWDAMLARKRITQQEAIVQLMLRAVDADDVAQSMLLGQLTPADDLIAVVLRRGRKRKK